MPPPASPAGGGEPAGNGRAGTAAHRSGKPTSSARLGDVAGTERYTGSLLRWGRKLRRASGDWYHGQVTGESGVRTWGRGRAVDCAGRPASAADAGCAGPAMKQGHASSRRSVHLVYGTFAGHWRDIELCYIIHAEVRSVNRERACGYRSSLCARECSGRSPSVVERRDGTSRQVVRRPQTQSAGERRPGVCVPELAHTGATGWLGMPG